MKVDSSNGEPFPMVIIFLSEKLSIAALSGKNEQKKFQGLEKRRDGGSASFQGLEEELFCIGRLCRCLLPLSYFARFDLFDDILHHAGWQNKFSTAK